MAASRGRLFALHMNDGYGRQDDGLVVGSVHPIETIESFFYLQRSGFEGHLYFDTFPINEDPVREAEWNLTETRRLWDVAAALADDGAFQQALEAQDALTARRIIRDALTEKR